jgi:hypothetical protein
MRRTLRALECTKNSLHTRLALEVWQVHSYDQFCVSSSSERRMLKGKQPKTMKTLSKHCLLTQNIHILTETLPIFSFVIVSMFAGFTQKQSAKQFQATSSMGGGKSSTAIFLHLCFTFFMFLCRSLRSDVFLSSFLCCVKANFGKRIFSYEFTSVSEFYLFNCEHEPALLEVKWKDPCVESFSK